MANEEQQRLGPVSRPTGFPWGGLGPISEEAEKLRKQYETCPTEDIPESVQRHWLSLVGIGAFSLRDLSAGIPGPPAEPPATKPSDDSYEFRLTSYPSLVSGDGLKPVKPWRLEDQDRDTLLGIAQRSVVRLRGQAEHIRTIEAALKARNAKLRVTSHTLRLVIWVNKARGGANEREIAKQLDAYTESRTAALRRQLEDVRTQSANWRHEHTRETEAHAQTKSELELSRTATKSGYARGFEDGKRERVEEVEALNLALADVKREHDGLLVANRQLDADNQRLKERLNDEHQRSENYRAAVVRSEEVEKTLRTEIDQILNERDRAREQAQACTYTQEEVRQLEAIKEARELAERECKRLRDVVANLEYEKRERANASRERTLEHNAIVDDLRAKVAEAERRLAEIREALRR